MARLLALLLSLSLGLAATPVLAQEPPTSMPEDDGSPGTAAELEAFGAVTVGNHVRARELGERLVKRSPRSYVGHLVLAHAHHYGEASFPLAVYHAREALRLFEARHGALPRPGFPWRWHALILRELAAAQQEVGDFDDALATIARYDERYQPRLFAYRAWPLMKLGRFDEARAAAAEGLATGDPNQIRVALNAMCAIEFEAGRDQASYDACRRAVEHTRSNYGRPEAVDLSNFAEAARSLFRLDEAESLLLEAAQEPEVSYGNPWRDLAELYLREARFPETVGALERIELFRALRPAHMRNSDMNEDRRALSSLLLVAGRSEEAIRITDQALVLVDRRFHNSRDPAQDRAVAALLDRAARRQRAAELRERSAARPWYERLWAEVRSLGLELSAYRSGREVVKLLSDRERLIGTFRLGTSDSGIMPPWLVGDLVSVLGPGVVDEAVRAARARDRREEAKSYYAAIEAEAALARGEDARAMTLAHRAAKGLPRGEALMSARAQAVLAEAALRGGRSGDALAAYLAALQSDPGVLRRLGHRLPVTVAVSGGALAEDVAEGIEHSPRFDVVDRGFPVRVQAGRGRATVCLYGPSGERIGCGEGSGRRPAQAALDAFHRDVFAPHVDLSQSDIHSLDGSTGDGRDVLDTLIGRLGAGTADEGDAEQPDEAAP